nr:protein FAM83A-like [Zonotrichia albicollis]
MAGVNSNPYLVSSSSFTWLCGQVHRNLLSKFTGQVVELFDEEFRHLYALSKPVRGPRTPPRSLPFLFSRSWAPPRSLPYSEQGSANTLSDFSSLSAGSAHQSKQAPRTLMFNSNFSPQSPLQRVNSFHSYMSFTPPPPQPAIQPNYYQPHYMATENATVPYNNMNMNIYRPIRLRQEEPNRTGLSSSWRCLHKANLFA